MAPTELWKLDATGQAALVRAGDVKPADLVELAAARIELLNRQVNAVVTPLYDEARRAAEVPPSAGAPFAGVPLLLKDASIEVEGVPYAIGTSVLRDIGWRSRRTTELARRFVRAGFVFIGKTNVPELSSGVTTEPRAFGPTRNPWDLSRTAGGSSGGSAAAVACGMTAVAHGADATGSLRYPAGCCGVVTLKPSRGCVPSEAPAAMPDPDSMWTEFVLARSVRDLAGILDAVGGSRTRDRHVVAPPERYVESLSRPIPRLRVGLLKRDVMSSIPTDQECVTAVERTGTLLASLGHEVDEHHPPALDGLFLRTMEAISVVSKVMRYAQCRWLAHIAGRELVAGDLLPENLVTADGIASVSAMDYLDASELLDRETRPIHEWWGAHDLLVTPTLRQPAWPLGSNGGALDAGTFPAPFSFTGQPAVSLPLHWTNDGLPVGVQIVGARGQDALVLAVAAQLEAAAPWRDRWPPIAEKPAR